MEIDAGTATIIAAIIGAIATVFAGVYLSKTRGEKQSAPSDSSISGTHPESPSVSTETPTTSKPPSSSEFKGRARVPESRSLLNVQKLLRAADDAEYSFRLNLGDRITGSIDSDGPIDFYLLDSRNRNKWVNDEVEEVGFSYLEGDENVTKYSLDCEIDKTGTWYLVIENPEDGDDVEVNIALKVSAAE